MIKFTEEFLESSAGSAEKYCSFVWGGMTMGPVFCACAKDGKASGAPGDRRIEAAKLTRDFVKETFGRKYGDMRKFGEDAGAFAEKNGWTVVANEYASSEPSALSEGEMTKADVEEFREKLRNGVVTFRYRKTDKPMKVNRKTGEVTPAVVGEVVTRRGTLKQDIIDHTMGEVSAAERAHRIPSEFVVTYFDMGAENKKTGKNGDWRCFRIDRFEGYAD